MRLLSGYTGLTLALIAAIPLHMTRAQEDAPVVAVQPSSAPTGSIVTITGKNFPPGDFFPAVLSPVSEGQGFPTTNHPRGNGCLLKEAIAGEDGTFSVAVTIPTACTTLNGDPAQVMPGKYTIWDTGNEYPPRSTSLVVTESAPRLPDTGGAPGSNTAAAPALIATGLLITALGAAATAISRRT